MSSSSIEIKSESKDEVTASKRWFRSMVGMLLIISSSAVFSLNGAIVRLLVGTLAPSEMAAYRFGGMTLLTLPSMLAVTSSGGGNLLRRMFHPKTTFAWLVLRGLLGGSGIIIRYYTFKVLPLGDGNCISLSSPIFVTILAWIFLKERIGWTHLVCLILTLLGVGITSRIDLLITGFEEDASYRSVPGYPLGVLGALCATAIGAVATVLVRHLKAVPSQLILFNLGWIACLETTIVTLTPLVGGFRLPYLVDHVIADSSLTLKGNCSLHDAQGADQLIQRIDQVMVLPWLVLAIVLLSFYGNWLATCSLQLENAALVSLVRPGMGLIFSFTFEWVFFGHPPDNYSIGGGALSLFSILIITARKSVLSSEPGSWLRRNASWLTR